MATGAKVAWEAVCRPKRVSGLGSKRVEKWNEVAIMKHIWNLFCSG